jgi:hypothetical protein
VIVTTKFISRNFDIGRFGYNPDYIILHTYNGKGTSVFPWFNSAAARVSAHFAVLKDGTVEQYVDIYNAAWHSGNREGNLRGIGIEHQDDGNPADPTRTDALYESSAQLCASIYRERGWNFQDMNQIRVHKEFTNTGCPGGLDVQRIKNRVFEILNPKPQVDNYYRVFKGKDQIGAYSLEENAFDSFINGGDKVTFKGEDITLVFLNTMDTLQKQIQTLKAQKADVEGQNEKLIETNAQLYAQLQDATSVKPEEVAEMLTLTQLLNILFKKLTKKI